MPHYFFDTSALVKHYHTESGSLGVDQILGEAGSDYSVARLTLAEGLSVFAKKAWMGEISDADFDRLRLRFYADVRDRKVTPVRIFNVHFESAGNLIAKLREDATDPHPRRDSARRGFVDSDARPDRSFRLLRSKTLRHRLARGVRGYQS